MIEELRGEGEIYAGDRLVRRTRYRLIISKGDAPSAAGIEGTIELATEGEAMVLARVEQLTLLLDDGRYLAFSLASRTDESTLAAGLQGVKTSPSSPPIHVDLFRLTQPRFAPGRDHPRKSVILLLDWSAKMSRVT